MCTIHLLAASQSMIGFVPYIIQHLISSLILSYVLCPEKVIGNISAHPNIKLFISHGGLLSMEEGVYNEVPFVVVPYYGDQLQYANFMQVKGIGKIVNKDSFIKKEELKGAILEVIKNPSYKIAVQKLKFQTFDMPDTGLEKAIWWIEYVIRQNGTKHLRNSSSGLPSYQYYSIDVISCLFLGSTLSLILAILTLKLAIRWLNHQLHSKSVQREAKKRE